MTSSIKKDLTVHSRKNGREQRTREKEVRKWVKDKRENKKLRIEKRNQKGKTESEQECDSGHVPIGYSLLSL